jgi:hypothetical protein
MEELLLRIFGGYTMVDVLSFTWFILIGYAIYALVETTGRDISSKKTPRKWSWMFWLKDNWKRYITTILCTYALFRFYTEFIGRPFGDFEALMIGLVGDGIAATAKKRIKAFTAERRKMMESYKDDDIG